VIPGYAPERDLDRRVDPQVLVQRRRIAVAIVVTVLAVIVSLASGSGSGSESSDTSGESPTGVPVTGLLTDEPGTSSPADPAFLPGANVVDAPEIITVNVPAPPTGTVISGRASFIRWPQTLGLAPCATPHALIGAKITVTNLNNARSVVCDNVSIESLGGGNTIIIHSDVFLEIADLVDAPIPVEIEF
jgi:hypothetical protein